MTATEALKIDCTTLRLRGQPSKIGTEILVCALLTLTLLIPEVESRKCPLCDRYNSLYWIDPALFFVVIVPYLVRKQQFLDCFCPIPSSDLSASHTFFL